MKFLKDIFSLEKKPHKGLFAVEWAILAYMLFTTILIMAMFDRLHCPQDMLMFRLSILVMMAAMWGVYRLVPCKVTVLLRVALQLMMLKDWYPDTYEFNRCFDNLDHIFCQLEQTVFGCQPAIEFSRLLPWGIVSEPLDFGYAAYYPIIGTVAFYYLLKRYQYFQKSVFIIMSSFFLYYVFFIFVPVAGPTFYFKAVGLDNIQQGIFPVLGHYFDTHSDLSADCLPTPGWQNGLCWYLVEVAKWAGERPTAAFPSSHVGVSTVCMWLAWKSHSRRLFYCILPVFTCLCFATVYIQAHYAIDAIAGLISGSLIFWLLWLLPIGKQGNHKTKKSKIKK